MARPREFDEDVVLDQVLDLFWARGYDATSVSDLLEATGLAKGSLYKAFGDKKSLFVRSLDRYLERGRDGLRQLASTASSPLDALERWLLYIVELATCKGERRGCYAVNCAVELGPHDDEVRARLQSHRRVLKKLYCRLLDEAAAQGLLREGVDSQATARLLATVIDGLHVGGKLGATRSHALETVRLVLNSLAP